MSNENEQLELRQQPEIPATENIVSSEVHANEAKLNYPFFKSVRFLCVTLVGFLGTINLFVIRANLSIALPCMVYINTSNGEFKPAVQVSNESLSTAPPGCVRQESANVTSGIMVHNALLLMACTVQCTRIRN